MTERESLEKLFVEISKDKYLEVFVPTGAVQSFKLGVDGEPVPGEIVTMEARDYARFQVSALIRGDEERDGNKNALGAALENAGQETDNADNGNASTGAHRVSRDQAEKQKATPSEHGPNDGTDDKNAESLQVNQRTAPLSKIGDKRDSS